MLFLLVKIRLITVSYAFKKSTSVSYKAISYKFILFELEKFIITSKYLKLTNRGQGKFESEK